MAGTPWANTALWWRLGSDSFRKWQTKNKIQNFYECFEMTKDFSWWYLSVSLVILMNNIHFKSLHVSDGAPLSSSSDLLFYLVVSISGNKTCFKLFMSTLEFFQFLLCIQQNFFFRFFYHVIFLILVNWCRIVRKRTWVVLYF